MEKVLSNFSNIYLNNIKENQNILVKNQIIQYKYFNKILANLIKLRMICEEEDVSIYTNLIIKVKDKISKINHYKFMMINNKFDKYYKVIVERICPLIYELNDYYNELFLTSTNYYINNDDRIKVIFNMIKDEDFKINLSVGEIKEYTKLLKYESIVIKKSSNRFNKRIRTLSGKLDILIR